MRKNTEKIEWALSPLTKTVLYSGFYCRDTKKDRLIAAAAPIVAPDCNIHAIIRSPNKTRTLG